jgi:hypothetical protein
MRQRQQEIPDDAGQPCIAIDDLPKIGALNKLFPNFYRDTPVLVAVAQPAN